MATAGVGLNMIVLSLVPSFAGAFAPRLSNMLPTGELSTRLLSSTESEDMQVSDVPAADEHDVHDNDPARYRLMKSLYKAQIAMAPDFFSTALPAVDDTLVTFHQICVDAVTVAPSTIPCAGKGLFAQRDLKRGTIVSLYPVHATGINFFDDGSSYWITLDEEDEKYFFKDTEGEKEANYLVYLLGNRSPEEGLNGAPFVDANPNRSPRPGWLAHYINDGAIITSNSERGVLDYLESSSAKENCAICPFGPSPLMAAVTTIDVKKGEELLTSYGSSYWLDDLCSSKEDWPAKTDSIVSVERGIAETMFSSMDRAAITYENEAEALEYVFEIHG